MKTLILLLAFFLIVQNTDAELKEPISNQLTKAQQFRVNEIENRLEEIKAIGFRIMSKSEIEEAKSDMKEMKAETRAISNGNYLSLAQL